ncbi:MAG TPA: DUF4846 domain-containing protein [Acidobacteriota bacterium]|nr:DUF4846 domain-containing protein [Acidobacteriota bacterium]HNB69561.1 DUF4846 domain-containing protein [Acidobacteriota bacterium]
MRFPLILVCLLTACSTLGSPTTPPLVVSPTNANASNQLIDRIRVPAGYQRLKPPSGSFATWLQHLQLKPGTPAVHLFDGSLKKNQSAHVAVIDMDTGDTDLQQCADAVMRLRAEYLFSSGKKSEIGFNFTSGFRCDFAKWAEGYRPEVTGNNVRWVKTASVDASYKSFREYLIPVFTYAGTASLSQELKPVSTIQEVEIGDVFIQGGFPGHAVIVVDVALHQQTKDRLFLLAQSYMPAQEIHILRNPTNDQLSPWYSANAQGNLETPEWTFPPGSLKRFGE